MSVFSRCYLISGSHHSHSAFCEAFEKIRTYVGGVVTNVLCCDILISNFERQSHYHVHFQTKKKGMNPLILHLWDK